MVLLRGRVSDLSVALVAGGSALGASLVTGVLTWLAGRSQTGLQLADQRKVRREQLRREAYARCIELLTEHLTLITDCGRAGWEGAPQSLNALGAQTEALTRRGFAGLAELYLLGPNAVVDLFARAQSKLEELERATKEALRSPRPSDDSELYALIEQQAVDVGEALTNFCVAARVALDFHR